MHHSNTLRDLQVSIAVDWSFVFANGICCPALIKLDVKVGCDADLVCICRAAPNLEELILYELVCTDVGLASIGQHCHLLKRLTVETESEIDVGFVALAEGCPKLKHLDLGLCEDLTDIGLIAIGTYCTQLEHLMMFDNRNVTSTSLLALAHNAGPRLLHVFIDGCSEITGASILALATHCPMLHTVAFGAMILATETDLLLAIAHIKNVKDFSLTFCHLTDLVLEQIAEHMHLLETLNIGEGEHMYSVAGITKVVQKCEKLRYLELCEPHDEVDESIVRQWYAVRPGLKIEDNCLCRLNLETV